MKDGHPIRSDWQDDSDAPSRRWLRGLRWLAGLMAVAALAYLSGLADDWRALLVLLGTFGLTAMLWRAWSARRGKRRWRRDSSLVVPSLPMPVSRISAEREWSWPSKPLVRAPMAIALVIALYWAIVMNQLQLPPPQLFAVVLLALVNLWCWHDPLLLVLIVIPCVMLLALMGWLVASFSLIGAIGLLLVLSVVIAVTATRIRKRFNRNSPWQ